MQQVKADFVVLISAGAEWRATLPLLNQTWQYPTPYGKYFSKDINGSQIIFFHGGWGKVATAGATQFAIERWHPRLLINLGTCGGFAGLTNLNEILLAEETVIYDIIEGMSDFEAAIKKYSSRADFSWLGDDAPVPIRPARLLSADRDLRPEDIPQLISQFQGIAADWESGAFAWVATRNRVDWLVLRGVSDLVDENQSEALGNVKLWQERTGPIMQTLLDCLTWVITRYQEKPQEAV